MRLIMMTSNFTGVKYLLCIEIERRNNKMSCDFKAQQKKRIRKQKKQTCYGKIQQNIMDFFRICS